MLREAVRSERRHWIILFALCFLKYLPAGLNYYPMLDDYIQYWGYAQYADVWADIIIRLGILTTHPLSGLADVYVWSRLFEFSYAVLAIITCLHIITAYMIIKVL